MTQTITNIRVGDRVDGQEGPLGTVEGTREAMSGQQAGYVVVRLSRLFGLVHRTRLVPLAWVKEARPDTRRVTLDATRAEVAGCPPVRADEDIRADVVQALTRDPLTRRTSLQVESRLGNVTLSGEVPSDATKQRATALAEAVAGVTQVRNDATVPSNSTS